MSRHEVCALDARNDRRRPTAFASRRQVNGRNLARDLVRERPRKTKDWGVTLAAVCP